MDQIAPALQFVLLFFAGWVSLIRLLQSQIDVSIGRLLEPSDGQAAAASGSVPQAEKQAEPLDGRTMKSCRSAKMKPIARAANGLILLIVCSTTGPGGPGGCTGQSSERGSQDAGPLPHEVADGGAEDIGQLPPEDSGAIAPADAGRPCDGLANRASRPCCFFWFALLSCFVLMASSCVAGAAPSS